MYSLNCKGRLLSWEDPIVMGILNLTPDSFYAGSRMKNKEMLIRRAETMLSEGAIILDMGGMSSRPGATEISEETEFDRLIPAIHEIASRFPQAFISVDSYRYGVAKAALDAGASIINDIGAGESSLLAELAGKSHAPYICMHIRGNPQTMQGLTHYDDITSDILDFFIQKSSEYRQMGIKDLILDPGFGFAKTTRQNFQFLKQMKAMAILGFPVLAGLSRKATIYRTLGIKPEESLNGTTAMHTLALEQGAQILRVHDVKEAVQAIRLWTSYTYA